MKKLKILQVNKSYYPAGGGIERIVQQIAEGLGDQVDMKVLVCQQKGPDLIENIKGIEIHKSGSFGIFLSTPLSFSFFKTFSDSV
jgi:rhamnosyl/mannosyltransferase